MNELTEQVIGQLYDYLDDKYTTEDAAIKLIALITEACVEAVKTLGYPEDEIYAEAIRALIEVKE